MVNDSSIPEGGGILVIGPVLGLLMWVGIFLAASMVSGCGIYVHRGGGAYTFVGPGSMGVGNRCSSYAQWSPWNPNYDYKKLDEKLKQERAR